MSTEYQLAVMLTNFFYSLLKYPKYIVGTFVICAIMVFLPKKLAIFFGLESLTVRFRWFFSIILIVCSILLILEFYSICKKKFQRHSEEKAILKKLNSLETKESEYLLYCMKNNEQTIFGVIDDPVARSLLQKGIVSMDPINRKTNYTIKEFVWEHLHKHQEYYLKMFTVKIGGTGSSPDR